MMEAAFHSNPTFGKEFVEGVLMVIVVTRGGAFLDSVVSLSALIFGFFFAGDLLEDVDWHDVTSLTDLDAATLVMSLSGEDFAGAG